MSERHAPVPGLTEAVFVDNTLYLASQISSDEVVAIAGSMTNIIRETMPAHGFTINYTGTTSTFIIAPHGEGQQHRHQRLYPSGGAGLNVSKCRLQPSVSLLYKYLGTIIDHSASLAARVGRSVKKFKTAARLISRMRRKNR